MSSQNFTLKMKWNEEISQMARRFFCAFIDLMQSQDWDDSSDLVLIEINGVAPKWVATQF